MDYFLIDIKIFSFSLQKILNEYKSNPSPIFNSYQLLTNFVLSTLAKLLHFSLVWRAEQIAGREIGKGGRGKGKGDLERDFVLQCFR